MGTDQVIPDDLDKHASGILFDVQAILVDLTEAVKLPLAKVTAIEAITGPWKREFSLQKRLNDDLALLTKHSEDAYLSVHDDYVPKEKYNELEARLEQMKTGSSSASATTISSGSSPVDEGLRQKKPEHEAQAQQTQGSRQAQPISQVETSNTAKKLTLAPHVAIAIINQLNHKNIELQDRLKQERIVAASLAEENFRVTDDATTIEKKVADLEEQLGGMLASTSTLARENENLLHVTSTSKREVVDLKQRLKDAKKIAMKKAIEHFQSIYGESSSSEAGRNMKHRVRAGPVIDMTADEAQDTPVKSIEPNERLPNDFLVGRLAVAASYAKRITTDPAIHTAEEIRTKMYNGQNRVADWVQLVRANTRQNSEGEYLPLENRAPALGIELRHDSVMLDTKVTNEEVKNGMLESTSAPKKRGSSSPRRRTARSPTESVPTSSAPVNVRPAKRADGQDSAHERPSKLTKIGNREFRINVFPPPARQNVEQEINLVPVQERSPSLEIVSEKQTGNAPFSQRQHRPRAHGYQRSRGPFRPIVRSQPGLEIPETPTGKFSNTWEPRYRTASDSRPRVDGSGRSPRPWRRMLDGSDSTRLSNSPQAQLGSGPARPNKKLRNNIRREATQDL